jgi:ribosome biogenesis protein Nip4
MIKTLLLVSLAQIWVSSAENTNFDYGRDGGQTTFTALPSGELVYD